MVQRKRIKVAKVQYKVKPRLKSFFLFILVTALIYAGTVLIQQELKFHEQSALKAKLSKQIVETKDKNEELLRQIEYSKTDGYIEKIIREKLGWVKPGEIKFVQKKD